MVARSRTRAAKPVETEEQKIARLEDTLEDLYAQREKLDAQILDVEEQLAEFETPFIEGDIAKNRQGARVKVLEVAPAFGSHIARVVFVDNKNLPKDGKVYTYDCSDLTLVDGVK